MCGIITVILIELKVDKWDLALIETCWLMSFIIGAQTEGLRMPQIYHLFGILILFAI